MVKKKVIDKIKIKQSNDKILDKEISTVKNPFQAILVILSHPKMLIGLAVVIIIILSFASIRIIYDNGHVKWEKKELKVDKTLEKVNKIKNVLTEGK
jgi:hypothetical protein